MPSTQVVATAFSDTKVRGTGKVEPIAWTNTYGQGRVFYSSLGHVASEFEVPQMRTILRRGMVWAAR
jgi:hypothetical protein